MDRRSAALAALVLLAGCSPAPSPTATTSPGGVATSGVTTAPGTTTPGANGTATTPLPSGTVRDGQPFAIREVATLDQPWAMTFLPSGQALITLRPGAMLLLDPATGRSQEVGGVPEVDATGQGGLHDVILGPTYADDGTVYLSWVESADGLSHGVVGRGTLLLDGDGSPRLKDLRPIWQQDPTAGSGHFSLRLALSPDEDNLFVTSGDRQKMTPAQHLQTNLGKILRLTLDGEHVPDNPFVDEHNTAAQIWSYGHRNPLGIAFDEAGNLWSTEMGPKGGDELNLIEPGANYGWPNASEGEHYDGREIAKHATIMGVDAPAVSWVPSISPANLMIYTETSFGQWTGDAFIGGLSGKTLVRVDLDGKTARKADQWDMGARIREVAQGPDGSIWLLTDGPDGRLLQLTPAP